jgi:hypothetical protein
LLAFRQILRQAGVIVHRYDGVVAMERNCGIISQPHFPDLKRPEKKRPRISPGPFAAVSGLDLDPYYVRGLKPFRTLGYFERYLIAFNKGFKTIAADCGEMTKYIITTIFLLQKSKTLAVVKPFYSTIYHVFTFS